MYNSNTSNMHRLNYLLFLALSLVFLTGCGKDGRSSVYGTWTEVFPEEIVDAHAEWTFNRDGSGYIFSFDLDWSKKIPFSFVFDDGIITLNYEESDLKEEKYSVDFKSSSKMHWAYIPSSGESPSWNGSRSFSR